MRSLSAGLAAHLAGEALTLAMCVKVSRRDGPTLGFTSLDRDLVVDGLTYEAASSVQASAIQQEASAGIDNLDLMGLLSSDRITDADLRAGRYDGAGLEIFLVNYADLTQGRVVLLRGYIGGVQISDGNYVAEVRSLSQRLSQQIGELTSPLCRVMKLGDTRCGVNLTSFRHTRTVSQVDSRYVLRFGSTSLASDYFSYGLLTLTSGANIDLAREIKLHTLSGGTTAILTLQEPFPFPVQVGDTGVLEAGCDRRFTTCRTKFANVENFRGEPHVPGTDEILKRGRK